jgi:hypothetical protein
VVRTGKNYRKFRNRWVLVQLARQRREEIIDLLEVVKFDERGCFGM